MKKLSLLLFMVCFAFGLSAQRTISGTVVDNAGESLIGVNITAAGTTVGTITDIDGTYNLSVPEGSSTLIFSYTGYTTKEIEIGTSSVIDLTLSEGLELDEVVVTAFGIKRDKKALGYSVTTIEEEAFQLSGESDPARILSGRVAGVNVIPQGGFLGGSTNVIVRSKGSITGSNQPLYVIDGAPFSGNIADIDPANIVSTSVLKGLTASVLYGQEGRNGVILITTRNGISNDTESIDISLTQSITYNQVSNLPEFQNTYGNGSDNATFIGFFGTWGGAFDPNIQVPHYYSTGRHPAHALYPEYAGVTEPFVPIEDNVTKFFGDGLGSTTSLNLNSSKGGTNVNFNLGYDNQKGYIDENIYSKFNAGVGISEQINDRLTVKGNVNYTKVNSEIPDLNFFDVLNWIPRNFPIHDLPFQNPIDGSNVYYRTGVENPRWILANQNFTDARDRIFATANGVYKLTDFLSLSYQAGYNSTTLAEVNHSNRGGVFGDNLIGFLRSTTDKITSLDQNLQLRLGTQPLADKFEVSGLLGLNYRNSRRDFDGIYSSDQITYGLLDHDNFRTHDNAGDFLSRTNIMGLYGQFDFSYGNWAYLSLSGRNDWGSSLEKENRSLFYPSASLSLVLSDVADFGQQIDYVKLRMGYASSAGFPDPYLTRNTLQANGQAFIGRSGTISTQNLSSFLANPGLKPELSEEIELGLDFHMFKKRIALDATYFQRINEDQLLRVSRPLSTGVSSSIINAGRIDTKGWELGLTLVPIRTNDFEWEVYTVFTAIENEVKSLPEDNLNIYQGINWAVIGEPLGVFRGDYAVRDDSGNLLIQGTGDDAGKLIESGQIGEPFKILGDPNEDWRGSIINTISYKNLTLSAQLEMVGGGDIYSFTTQNLLRRGVTIDTEDREGSFVIPGILADPTTGDILMDANGSPQANTIQLGTNDIYFLGTQDTAEGAIYDATTIRLRQARLAYRLDQDLVGNLPFKNVVVSVTGNNLWFETPNMPKGVNIDPEVNTAVAAGDQSQGVDLQNDPAYKKITFSLQLNF